MLSMSVSPSRTYVVMCVKPNFDGYYFRKFVLPKTREEKRISDADDIINIIVSVENNSSVAGWYFLNVLSFTTCIGGVMSWEDYGNIKDESTRDEKWEGAMSVARSRP